MPPPRAHADSFAPRHDRASVVIRPEDDSHQGASASPVLSDDGESLAEEHLKAAVLQGTPGWVLETLVIRSVGDIPWVACPTGE